MVRHGLLVPLHFLMPHYALPRPSQIWPPVQIAPMPCQIGGASFPDPPRAEHTSMRATPRHYLTVNNTGLTQKCTNLRQVRSVLGLRRPYPS